MSEKTHAEIIEEMNCGPIPEHRHDREILRHYAYSLDLAHKREMDDLRQLRDVLGKRAEKNLERCAELDAEVAAKDEVIKRLNDAIAEDQRRKMATAENSSAFGSAAKLREALVQVQKKINYLIGNLTVPNSLVANRMEINGIINAALAAPPRNCDVGSAEEQTARFAEFCYKNKNAESCCADCPIFTKRVPRGAECELTWAQMPYESERRNEDKSIH